MTRRYVYGVYPNYTEAELQADSIINTGVPRSAVSIVANTDLVDYSPKYDYIRLEQLEDNRSWFDKLFGIGEDPNYVEGDIDFNQYETSLRNGEVLLVVDSEYEGQLVGLNNKNYGVDPLFANDREGVEVDSENIRLHEERVNIDKVRKDKGEVEITKEVIKDTQTVEVPVEREEIHIKHKTPTQDGINDVNAFEEEEIIVPLSEEEVVVNKDTVVTDEVEVSKTAHTDYKTVSEETRREELNIQNEDELNIKEDKF